MGPEAARIARRQLGRKESSTTLVKEQAFNGYVGLGISSLLGCKLFRAEGPLLQLNGASTTQDPTKTWHGTACHGVQQRCRASPRLPQGLACILGRRACYT